MARAELDRLCGHCVTRARKALAKDGKLVPFAAAIRRGGSLVRVVSEVPGVEINGAGLVELLAAGLRELARQQQVSALALCFEGLVSSEEHPDRKRAAIVVGMEHLDGESIDVFVPFRKRKLFGYHFGKWTAMARTPSLFAKK